MADRRKSRAVSDEKHLLTIKELEEKVETLQIKDNQAPENEENINKIRQLGLLFNF